MHNKAKFYLAGIIIATIFVLSGCSTIQDAIRRAIIQMDNNWFERMAYQTTNIADYGKYIGNNDNEFAEEIIQSFFPAEIEDYFADVQYSYSAFKSDAAAFEAYLEFTIEDPDDFSAYVQQVTDIQQVHPFRYDDSFFEYTLFDYLYLGSFDQLSEMGPYEEGTEYYHIEAAKIGKILYSPSEQRIIYVAIGLHDGGGTGTYFLTTFFNRFGIDPKEYEKHLQEVSETAP